MAPDRDDVVDRQRRSILRMAGSVMSEIRASGMADPAKVQSIQRLIARTQAEINTARSAADHTTVVYHIRQVARRVLAEADRCGIHSEDQVDLQALRASWSRVGGVMSFIGQHYVLTGLIGVILTGLGFFVADVSFAPLIAGILFDLGYVSWLAKTGRPTT